VGVGVGRAERIESDPWLDRIESELRLGRMALEPEAPRIVEVPRSEVWLGAGLGVGVPGR
jgi:hypothetical protein